METQSIVRLVGNQKWLDDAATPLQTAVRDLFAAAGAAGREAKDLLHGKFLGHPLHPALTDIPVGAWTVAAIFDVAELTGGLGSTELADDAIGIGILGALAAAVAGIADWSETDARAKRIGLVHGVLNVTAVGLYTASLLARKRSRATGIALSLTGFATALASSFLGGHLSFGEQVGVDHTATADQELPQDFVAVLAESELPPDQPRKVVAEGVEIVLVRRNGAIYALRNACTHLGGPLAEGELDGDGIRCPWHRSRFCLKDGSVLDGPAVFPERVFDVRTRDGQIEVRARQL